MRTLIVCRDILYISNLKQYALAVLLSWAFLAPGLGAQREPSWGSTLTLNTKHGDGQAQVTAHLSLGSPLFAPCKEGWEAFPSVLLWGDPQLCVELFQLVCLSFVPKDRPCGPS